MGHIFALHLETEHMHSPAILGTTCTLTKKNNIPFRRWNKKIIFFSKLARRIALRGRPATAVWPNYVAGSLDRYWSLVSAAAICLERVWSIVPLASASDDYPAQILC